MNTTETAVYSKRHVLYGLNLAKKTKRPNIILCEGNLDVVTLHQAGFDNAVASMGTALTTEQIRLLSRFTRELVLCYDNDNAGQQATARALTMLNNTEFTVRVLKLPNRIVDGKPEKQDADDYIKAYGADAFEQLLCGSENGIAFRMAQVAAKYDLKDDPARVAYAGEIAEVLCTLENAVEREVYTVRAAETAQLPPESMRTEVNRAFHRRTAKDRKQKERRELNLVASLQPNTRELRYANVRSAMAEEGVIRLLLYDSSLFPDTSPLLESDFSSPLLGKTYTLLWSHRNSSSPMTVLSSQLNQEELSHITALMQKPLSTANAPQALQDYIDIIQEETQKRNGTEDPLTRALAKYKKKKAYGGTRT